MSLPRLPSRHFLILPVLCPLSTLPLVCPTLDTTREGALAYRRIYVGMMGLLDTQTDGKLTGYRQKQEQTGKQIMWPKINWFAQDLGSGGVVVCGQLITLNDIK